MADPLCARPTDDGPCVRPPHHRGRCTAKACGTKGGMNRHRAAGEPLCDECLAEQRRYSQQWELKRQARKQLPRSEDERKARAYRAAVEALRARYPEQFKVLYRTAYRRLLGGPQ